MINIFKFRTSKTVLNYRIKYCTQNLSILYFETYYLLCKLTICNIYNVHSISPAQLTMSYTCNLPICIDF